MEFSFMFFYEVTALFPVLGRVDAPGTFPNELNWNNLVINLNLI